MLNTHAARRFQIYTRANTNINRGVKAGICQAVKIMLTILYISRQIFCTDCYYSYEPRFLLCVELTYAHVHYLLHKRMLLDS